MMLILVLAGVVFSQSLNEWVNSEERVPLLSHLLYKYVPPPESQQIPHALSRFSLNYVVKRWYYGTDPFKQPHYNSNSAENEGKPWYLSDEDKAVLTQDPYKLAMAYFWDLGGIGRNLTLSIELLEYAASKGDYDAMFMLGVAHSTGLLGVIPEDQGRAAIYYSLAADAGSLEGQIAMGYRYHRGIHTVQDPDKALQYYRQAGLTLLQHIREFIDEERQQTQGEEPDVWFYPRVNPQIYSFGAEYNTGLYGRNVYRQHIPPSQSAQLWMGDMSASWQVIRGLFHDEFKTLDEAIDALAYRAEFEDDPAAMYGLARAYGATQSSWSLAAGWARKCVNQIYDTDSSRYNHQVGTLHGLCMEFLAERYLHGFEGTKRNFTISHWMYKTAAHGCKTCQAGMALADWREALQLVRAKSNHDPVSMEGVRESVKELVTPDVLQIDESKLLQRFEHAFNRTMFTHDYTLGMKLAEMYLAQGEYHRAVFVLRRVISDIPTYAPAASLLLAYLRPDSPDVLERYKEGVYALQDLFSPALFATRSYEDGDVESAMLGFTVSGELGVRSSVLNLADLLDTHHSLAGKSFFGKDSRMGRALSQWPVPSFVDGTKREALALKYFLLSAVRSPADALYKAIELCPDLAPRYLPILQRHNLGMAHFSAGIREFTAHKYDAAMELFSKAMVSPEAWVPVKISQFFTAIKLLPGIAEVEGAQASNGLFGWRKIYRAYRAIVAVDGSGAGTAISRHNSKHRGGTMQPPPHENFRQRPSTFAKILRFACLSLLAAFTLHVAVVILVPGGANIANQLYDRLLRLFHLDGLVRAAQAAQARAQ